MSNPERISIKELTLEEPEKKRELSFDPEGDLTEEYWRGMINTFELALQEGHPLDASSLAAGLKILSPERMDKLDFEDKTKEVMENFLISSRDIEVWDYFIAQAYALQIVFPGRISGFLLDDITWEGIKGELEKHRAKDWEVFANHAMAVKIAFPNKKSELQLDNTAWEGMKDILQQYRIDRDWMSYTIHAVNMRILYPEKTTGLGFDTLPWKEIKDEIKEPLTGSETKDFWRRLCVAFMYLKLLAAEEIKITDQGLEVIMQKEKPEFKEEIPPMPQRRSF